LHLPGVGPFLRTVDGGCALGATEGIYHVAGDAGGAPVQPGYESTQVDPVQPEQLPAPRAQAIALPVPKAGAQGLEHPGPAVGGGAAADADEKGAAAGV